MKRLDVGVIGCGTAGPAAALFLAEQGHAVTIYERVPEPRAVGAGIILQPTGQAVLKRLGLYEHIERRAARLDGLIVRHPDRKALIELSYDRVSPSYFGFGMHRGVLFEALFEAAKKHPNITMKLGVTGDSLARSTNKRFHLVDELGVHHGPHDLIIAADGAKSRFRDDTGLLRSAQPYPWGALWYLADDPEKRFDGKLFQYVDGTRRMLGLLPTGQCPEMDGTGDTTNKLSLYWSIDASTLPAFRAAPLDEWKEEVLSMEPEAAFVLDQITSKDELLFSQYHDVVMAPWHTRAVVHLGDSAHATSPQLGQGANLALWDAMVLADCIRAERSELTIALSNYSAMRRSHLGYYQFATRALTPFFQSNHDALGVLRDLVMPIASKIGFVNRAMVLGMTGTAAGFTLAELDLDLP